MKQKLFLKILSGIVAFVLLLIFLMAVVVEPWVGKKIQTLLNKNSSEYLLEIDKVQISIFKPGLELEHITLSSKQKHDGIPDLTGEIASVNFKGINLVKALLKNDIDVNEVSIFNSRIIGKIPFHGKARPPKISNLNVRIDSLFFDKLVVEIKDTATAQSYSLKDGVLKFYDIQVARLDTISPHIFNQFDLNVQEFTTVSADSMYSVSAFGINYSIHSKALRVDSFSIHPNYANYEFTSRYQFETDRFEGGFSRISFLGFSAADYMKYGNLIISSIEIGEMDMKIFRDKRKEFRHVKKPAFQDVIYNYPGLVNIDSIGILSGGIVYIEHVDKAAEPGIIRFNKFNARIYKITNDTVYKTEKAYLELKAEALLMGKAKMTTLLKARLFDSQNTFSVNGTLSEMEVMELNPMLEKNAFLYATSGKIDEMNFSFTANDTKATGKMFLLYHGLDVAVKNKRTDDTTAIKERVISVLANMKLINSNPLPGKELRVGLIDYERDPEKFVLNYCAKSILSGIKTSLVKNPENKRNNKKEQQKGTAKRKRKQSIVE